MGFSCETGLRSIINHWTRIVSCSRPSRDNASAAFPHRSFRCLRHCRVTAVFCPCPLRLCDEVHAKPVYVASSTTGRELFLVPALAETMLRPFFPIDHFDVFV